MTTNPYTPPSSIVEDIPSAQTTASEPPFFAVSVTKLAVLSLCTFGFYQLYWFNRNWRRIKAREQSNISPAPRAVFAVLFCYACFRRIRNFTAPAPGGSKLLAGPLATGWILTTLFSESPVPYSLVSLLSFVFIIPVQIRANQINLATSSNHDPNSHFTGVNWAFIVFGVIVGPLAVMGALLVPR